MDTTKKLYSDIIDDWFEEHKLKIMESTAYSYKKSIPNAKAYFSGVYIQDINADTLYDYVKWLREKYSIVTSARL